MPRAACSRVAKVEPGSMSPGEFSQSVRKAVEDDKVRVVLIDSLTGYLTAIPESAPAVVRFHELASYLAGCGVATFLTVAQQGMLGRNGVADGRQLYRRHDVHDAVLRGARTCPRRLRPEEAHRLHETAIREIGIKRQRAVGRRAARGFRGVLAGVPEYRGTSLDDRVRVGKKA